jgi:hypothetical protein
MPHSDLVPRIDGRRKGFDSCKMHSACFCDQACLLIKRLSMDAKGNDAGNGREEQNIDKLETKPEK